MNSKHTLLLIFTLMTSLLSAAEIHDTIESGESAKVAALLQKDPSLLQAKNAEGDQPLHLATRKDDPEIIKLLLEAGADVNAKGAKGWTPLHYAGSIDSKEACLALLENGANRDALNDASQKPEQTAKLFTRKVIKEYNPQMAGADKLFTAIEAGKAEQVKTIIAGNSKLLQAQDGQGKTPLVLAAQTNQIALVKLLIDAGAEVNAKGRHSALTKAAEGGHLEVVRLLLKHGAEVNPSRPDGPMDSMPLRAAAFTVDPTPAGAHFMAKANDMKIVPDGAPNPTALREMADQLKSHSSELVAGESIPKFMAQLVKPQPQPVRDAKRTILKLLLEAGADPKKDDQAIVAAAMSSETEMVRLLLERGANPNAELKGTGTALGYAVMIGSPLPLIQMLLTAGADPLHVTNSKLPLGASALSIAVKSKNKDVIDAILATLKPGELSEARHFEMFHSLMSGESAYVRRALDRGFKVNAKGSAGITGLTPLMMAVWAKPEIVAMLLDAGADVKARDEAGFTALHTAAEFGRMEQVALLLKFGADPEAKTKDGGAPLLAACSPDGTEEVVAALLKANAKVNARDDLGRTALGKAAFFGKPRIVARLLQAGADPNHVDRDECSVLYQTAGGPSQDKLVAPEKSLTGIKQANLGSKEDYLECAKLLIKQGAKVNGSTDGKNRLPLYYALSTGFEEMVDLLLENGAKVDIEAKARRTPILGAVESGIPKLLERTIALGAKPDTLVNDIGTTTLHAAASLKNPQMVEILLKHGAKVNAKSIAGITPLLNAVNFNNLECVRVLLKYGADPDIAAADGMTPRALATQQQLSEISKLLKTAK